MKKFTVKATVLAAGSVFGAAAFAGSFSAPTSARSYAVEGLTSSSTVTLPSVIYQMGVTRTTAQDYTVIIKPGSGATFSTASCAAAIPVVATYGAGAGGAATASLKRSSTAECAYEVDVTTAYSGNMNATDGIQLNFNGLAFASHALSTSGTTHAVTIDVYDLGETARIDNFGTLSVNVAASGNAISLTPVANTNLTSTNVNDAAGALFGFIPQNGDTSRVADANFQFNNNGGSVFFRPDGTTAWNFGAHGTNITLTVAGDFSGLAAGANAVTVNLCGTVSNMTVSGSTASVTLAAATCTAGPGVNTGNIAWTASGNSSLGTSRTFGLSGATATTGGTATTLAGNASWWTWTANAITLQTPYFSTDPGTGIFSRFYFTNTGAAASYTATCFAAGDAGAITYGTARTGTLSAGQTMINARDICTFADRTRGAVTFTINAPVNNIKGVYNLVVNATSNASLPLVRPYNAANTTE
jgi:hypothetical protein